MDFSGGVFESQHSKITVFEVNFRFYTVDWIRSSPMTKILCFHLFWGAGKISQAY